jgi:hypothetical protein
MYRIFCDLDGVLTDFAGHFSSCFSVPASTITYANTDQINFDERQRIISTYPNWWASMPWTKDGKELWDYIEMYDPVILSAPAPKVETCIADKIHWCNRELRGTLVIIETDKYKYANDKAILIDDYNKNIDEWVKKGGIGILHTSTSTTLEQLKKLGL